MRRLRLLVGPVVLAAASVGVVGAAPSSAATKKVAVTSAKVSLADKDCRSVGTTAAPDEPADFGTFRCGKPVDGWSVQVDYADARESLTLLKGSTAYDLNLWQVVSTGFSSLGDALEFRVRSGKAVGAVVRYTANVDGTERQVSNLVVIRLSPTPAWSGSWPPGRTRTPRPEPWPTPRRASPAAAPRDSFRSRSRGGYSWRRNADVAQLVEHHLAKVRVASSNLVVRSKNPQVTGLRIRRFRGRSAG